MPSGPNSLLVFCCLGHRDVLVLGGAARPSFLKITDVIWLGRCSVRTPFVRVNYCIGGAAVIAVPHDELTVICLLGPHNRRSAAVMRSFGAFALGARWNGSLVCLVCSRP